MTESNTMTADDWRAAQVARVQAIVDDGQALIDTIRGLGAETYQNGPLFFPPEPPAPLLDVASSLEHYLTEARTRLGLPHLTFPAP